MPFAIIGDIGTVGQVDRGAEGNEVVEERQGSGNLGLAGGAWDLGAGDWLPALPVSAAINSVP